MISQLCGNFFQEWGLLIILVVFLVCMLVFSSTRRKKEAKMAEDFANNLKIGDKIKTYSGIYGKIVSIKDTPSGKVATIETGEGKNASTITVDVFAIYNIEQPVQEKKQLIEEVKTIEQEEVKEEKAEINAEENDSKKEETEFEKMKEKENK